EDGSLSTSPTRDPRTTELLLSQTSAAQSRATSASNERYRLSGMYRRTASTTIRASYSSSSPTREAPSQIRPRAGRGVHVGAGAQGSQRPGPTRREKRSAPAFRARALKRLEAAA